MASENVNRGKRAGFDRRTGKVSGSGAGAGGNADAGEDYDSDLQGESAGRKGEDDISPARR